MPSNPNFAALLATAHALADRAGAVILPHFRSGLAIDHKGGALFDPVTAADLAAETAIREAIADTHPAHGIVGEEFGASRPEADYCWIIDPIDGTRAFIVGQPLWGTLIGLLRNGHAAARPDEPALHRRALLERGYGKAISATRAAWSRPSAPVLAEV